MRKDLSCVHFADGEQEALQKEAGLLSRGLERQIDPDQHLQITGQLGAGEPARVLQGLIDDVRVLRNEIDLLFPLPPSRIHAMRGARTFFD